LLIDVSVANKGSLARDLLDRYQRAYENLPKWLQQGVVVWNKGNIELENGSKVVAAATSRSQSWLHDNRNVELSENRKRMMLC
jgi:hypothetical protein